MRKLFYLGFCLALVTGVGCALTDYPVITDNNQLSNGNDNADGIINTNGKAHVIETQVATIWPDGSDEFLWFADQNFQGDQTLTTYNNFSTGAEPTFHDDLYCNPDWQGCAIVTADNPNEVTDDPFDYRANPNCDGYRSLSLLLSTTRYYGECGRNKLSLSDRISMLNMGRLGQQFGTEGLFYNMNRSNTSILLDNKAGFQTTLALNGDVPVFISMEHGSKRIALDMTNPLLGTVGRSYASFLGTHATGQTAVTITYNGISMPYDIAGNRGVSNAGRVNSNVNKHF